MTLYSLPTNELVAITASGEPVPGGGSVSALCGALSAALGQMVSNLTISKKKYADVHPQMKVVIEKLRQVMPLLLRAVDLDAKAYRLVFDAYKMPKEIETEKEARAQAIQEALRHAASVPFNVAKMVNSFLPDLLKVAEIGNQNAITDAYVATLCARTAILGACANVRINLTSITDAEYVEETTRDIEAMEAAAIEADEKARKMLLSKI